MSMLQMLETVHKVFDDDVLGIQARVADIANAAHYAVQNGFTIGKWALPDGGTPATKHRLVIRPSAGDDEPMQGQLERENVQSIAITVEIFGKSDDEIQDTIAVVQLAVLQVLSALRAYSDAHNGTVVEVLSPIRTQYGRFTGSATGSGFVSTVNIQERSPQ